MGCCGGCVILLRLRGSALLRQGLLSEPEASSAPVSMFLADFRSLSSIRRRSPARTAATSPAYGSFHPPHFHPPHKEKDGHPPKSETAVLSSHIIHRKSKHRKKIYLLTLLTVLPSRKALILSTVISMILCLEA